MHLGVCHVAAGADHRRILVFTDTLVRDQVHTGVLTALALAIEEQLSSFGAMLTKDEPQSREWEVLLAMLRQRTRG